MEKQKFNLRDVLQLEGEINGVVKNETNEVIFEGFINQNLSIILKYELAEFSDFLKNEKKKVENLRNDLIKKYGKEEKDGTVVVEMFNEKTDENGNVISKEFSESYLKFDQEYGLLLNQEIELEYPTITKEDLKSAGKTKDNYIILFKLIKKEEVK